jgi:hypothetical protein
MNGLPRWRRGVRIFILSVHHHVKGGLFFRSDSPLGSIFDSVVKQAIQQSVSDRRFRQVFMPASNGQLTGNQSGTAGMPVFDDLE